MASNHSRKWPASGNHGFVSWQKMRTGMDFTCMARKGRADNSSAKWSPAPLQRHRGYAPGTVWLQWMALTWRKRHTTRQVDVHACANFFSPDGLSSWSELSPVLDIVARSNHIIYFMCLTSTISLFGKKMCTRWQRTTHISNCKWHHWKTVSASACMWLLFFFTVLAGGQVETAGSHYQFPKLTRKHNISVTSAYIRFHKIWCSRP